MANAALIVDKYLKKDTSQWRIQDLTLGGRGLCQRGGIIESSVDAWSIIHFKHVFALFLLKLGFK